ncbi:hypothetical protein AGDE_16182 [Angomonas deanei]|uniref:F-box domain-containing protein n=1 Tax=Angomonas deanei TaxID=59799 RepID=A0A7G2CDX3_9TRYP|nr:hypothetical protein AGDE_16182 [Angomonas deanei]CAD2217699.1 hypothetical protein, conserved [Angomonas deanei]|eukprot:EPY17578.1 hypothetical protein AGDE_16182 [Angomonas deanei]
MNTSTGSRKSRNRLVFVSRPKKKRTPVTAVPVFRNPLQPADSPPPSETRLPYGGEESISSSAPEESPPLDHSPVLGEDSAPFAQENHDNREEEVHRDDYYLTGVKVHFLSLPPLPLALVLSYCTHEVVLQLRQVNRLFNQLYLTDVVANCFQTLPGREEALLGGTNAAGGPLTAHGGRVADIIVKRRQAYRQCRLVEDRRRQAWQYHTIGLAKKEEDPLHELRRAQAATALAAHSLQVAVTEYLHYCSRQRMVRYNIRNGLFNLTTFGAKPGVPGLEGVPLFKLLLHETDDPLHRGQVCILPGGVLGIWFYEETDFCIYVKQKKSQYLRSVGAFAGQDYYEEEVFYQKYMDQNTRDNANRYLFWPKNKKRTRLTVGRATTFM